MSIEDEVFKRKKLNEDKLIPFGFVKQGKLYKYSKKFLNDSFRADIYIDYLGNIQGKVFDLEIDEEYTNK